jgi:hypothetical protein
LLRKAANGRVPPPPSPTVVEEQSGAREQGGSVAQQEVATSLDPPVQFMVDQTAGVVFCWGPGGTLEHMGAWELPGHSEVATLLGSSDPSTSIPMGQVPHLMGAHRKGARGRSAVLPNKWDTAPVEAWMPQP